MNSTGNAWSVRSDGDVDYYSNDISYGRISPDTGGDYVSWYVTPSGGVYSFSIDFGVTGSYGSKHRRARICLHVLFILIHMVMYGTIVLEQAELLPTV